MVSFCCIQVRKKVSSANSLELEKNTCFVTQKCHDVCVSRKPVPNLAPCEVIGHETKKSKKQEDRKTEVASVPSFRLHNKIHHRSLIKRLAKQPPSLWLELSPQLHQLSASLLHTSSSITAHQNHGPKQK